MQHAAGRLPKSSAHSMNARKCVHAQKPDPTQTFAHESSKVGGRGKERKRDRGLEADGKKGSPTKQNHIEGTKTRPIYTAMVNKCNPPRATQRGKLRLHVMLIQAWEQKLNSKINLLRIMKNPLLYHLKQTS